jgi:lysophospholipase L1-like esterase
MEYRDRVIFGRLIPADLRICISLPMVESGCRQRIGIDSTEIDGLFLAERARAMRRSLWSFFPSVVIAFVALLTMNGAFAGAGESRDVAAGPSAAVPPAQSLLEFGSSPVTIVCLGDSVTGVYYHTGGRRAYPEMLELAIRRALPEAQAKVINAGISGHSTTEALARLDRDVLQHKPDLVTISFGLNDMTRVPEEPFVDNLATLVARCREAKAQVVLCTPNAVISTPGRPVEKLIRYCDRIRELGRRLNVPVCDQFAAGESLRARDAWAWRLTLSDEIHPNLDGHRRMAQELCRTITGKEVSLANVGPPQDFLARTRGLMSRGKPIRILAMPPFDALAGSALKQLDPQAIVEVTTWPTDGKSLAELERAANQLVRPMKPDLVILAVPANAATTSDEEFVRSYAWTLNWSLSFGHQEWDCVVIHPSVVTTDGSVPRGELIRQLVHAQDLTLIDRPNGDGSSTEVLFSNALKQCLIKEPHPCDGG